MAAFVTYFGQIILGCGWDLNNDATIELSAACLLLSEDGELLCSVHSRSPKWPSEANDGLTWPEGVEVRGVAQSHQVLLTARSLLPSQESVLLKNGVVLHSGDLGQGLRDTSAASDEESLFLEIALLPKEVASVVVVISTFRYVG